MPLQRGWSVTASWESKMLRTLRGTALGAVLSLISLATIVGCGDESATMPPDVIPNANPDAGSPQQAGPDAGPQEPPAIDGGIEIPDINFLSIIGNRTPTINYGNELVLRVLLTNSRTGTISGETISFTQVGSAGTLDATSAVTDESGIAEVRFTAGSDANNPTAIIKASAPGVDPRLQPSWSITVAAPNWKMVYVYPTSGKFPLTGGKQEQIVVQVLTQMNQPVEGVTVTFAFTGEQHGVSIDGDTRSSKEVLTSPEGLARINILLPISRKPVNGVESIVNFTASAPYTTPQLAFRGELKEKVVDCSNGQQCSPGEICVDTNGDGANDRCMPGCLPGDPNGCPDGKVCSAERECVVPQTCAESSECPIGQYCDTSLALKICKPGCDSTTHTDPPVGGECFSGMDCDVPTHTCGDCRSPAHASKCQLPYVCNQDNGQCLPVDISGHWKAVQMFHVQTLIPQSVRDAITKIEQGFGIALAVVQGRPSALLPESWRNFGLLGITLGGALDAAVGSALASYAPDWLKDIVYIGNDILTIIKDFEVHSDLKLVQDWSNDPFHVVRGELDGTTWRNSVDTWEKAIFFWYTARCPKPSSGPPPSCALLEIDLVKDAAVRPAPSPLEGQIDGATLRILGTHEVNLAYGKLVRIIVEKVIKATTGYNTIQEAIQAAINCQAISDWLRGFLRNIIGDLANGIDLKPACQSGVTAASAAVVNAIEGLNANLPLKLGGVVTIERPTDNNMAEALSDGVWDFYLNGNPTQRVGEWNAERP